MILLAQSAQILALLAFFVRVEAAFSNSWFAIAFPCVHDKLDPLLDFGDFFRLRSLAQLYAGASFIHKVNRLSAGNDPECSGSNVIRQS